MGPLRPDQRLAVLAERQHGVVTVAQLRAAGIQDHEIKYRVRVGRLHRVRHRVYAVGHGAISWEGACLAAVLTVGDGAVASHRSAAMLWGIVPQRPAPFEVTVTRDVRSRRGISVHVTSSLGRSDQTRICGIAVTSAARTLLDLADVAGDGELRRAVREALVRGFADERALQAQLARARGRHGAPRLAALIAGGPAPTRSELEDRTLELLHTAGLPRPAVNERISGLGRRVEVDFLFADRRLVIEADGARYHDNRIAREDDAARQALLEAAGYRVERVTWKQVTREAEQTVSRLRRAFRSS